jgi:predicted phage gp36 major capsid-like protein
VQDLPEVRSAYWKYLTVGSLSELDVEEQRALSRATGAAGNFLVPTDFYNQIIRALRFMGSVGQLATEYVTDNGDTIQVPANTAHGTASWTGENSAYTPSDETFAQVTLGAFKATSKIIISEELLQDSAFPPQYRANASFIVNDAAARNLYLMTDTQNRPLWNVNVATTGPDTFLGYPIYTDPDVPAPGVGNISVLFGDWKRTYVVRRVAGFSMQRQNELHSDNGQIGFRGQERVDGRVVLAAAGIALAHSAT